MDPMSGSHRTRTEKSARSATAFIQFEMKSKKYFKIIFKEF